MAKRLLTTPRSKVRAALRQLWLRSRERNQCLKNAKYCCAECGVKQSKAKGKGVKVNVHHKEGIDWEGVIDLIFERILHSPDRQEVLCIKCHDKEHEDGRAKDGS